MSSNLEERARELHAAINPDSCGFQYRQKRCTLCEEKIVPFLAQVQAEAGAGALQEAAELLKYYGHSANLVDEIRALFQAVPPAKENVK